MKKSVVLLVLMMGMLIVGCGEEEKFVPQVVTPTKIPEEAVTSTADESSEEESDDIESTEGQGTVTENNESKNFGREDLNEYMDSIKEQAHAISSYLENEAMTQLDMNEKSLELYELWDGALNHLWSELKSLLSEEDFTKLLEEQRTWIAEKEKAVKEAGKEVEGGSMYPLVVNLEAAKITEERVCTLYELLK